MSIKDTFYKKYQKVPVVEVENNTPQKPLVSINVQTYNHEKYISKCLDGILMQQTNFDFEILVGEDKSSDKTREVCLEYAKKHPEKIRLFLHSRENNISVYGKPTALFNSRNNVVNARGKYIAVCEGDDFWIDPLKLQKQVDFLEANPDYGLVHSDIYMIDSKNELIEYTDYYRKMTLERKDGYVFWDLLNLNFINTLTVCVRKDIYKAYLERHMDDLFAYDYNMWLYFSVVSKIKFLDEKMAKYRVHAGGASQQQKFFEKRRPLVIQSAIIDFFELSKNKKVNNNVLSDSLYQLYFSKKISKQEKEPILKFLRRKPKYYFLILKAILNKVKNKFINFS